MSHRFKIDVSTCGVNYPYVLYVKTSWRNAWRRIDSFRTIQEARNFYHQVKDLPEYLP